MLNGLLSGEERRTLNGYFTRYRYIFDTVIHFGCFVKDVTIREKYNLFNEENRDFEWSTDRGRSNCSLLIFIQIFFRKEKRKWNLH
jgi:hypothetical protein